MGSKITTSWNRQYVGKRTSPPLVVVKTKPDRENEIEAISGATVSSNALTEIINDAVEEFRSNIAPGTARKKTSAAQRKD